MRTCTSCKLEKTFGDFNKQPGGKYGIKSQCRACQREDSLIRYWQGNAKEYQKYYSIEKKYGLSKDQYDELAKDGCNICPNTTDLVVDHCHETGEVRGILCRTCNTGIGHLKDSPELVMRAYDYLIGARVVA